MQELESIISSFSYIAIFLLMIANGVTNIPSSQIIYLISGYLISTGTLFWIPTVIAGALGNTIGNIITFLLVKKYDKPFAKKILMLDEGKFDSIHRALHATFSRHGMWWIFFGKIIPSVKAFIPVVAGLAYTPTVLTSFIFLIASTLWSLGVLSLGYFFGKSISLSSFSIVSLIIGVTVILILYTVVKKNIKKAN